MDLAPWGWTTSGFTPFGLVAWWSCTLHSTWIPPLNIHMTAWSPWYSSQVWGQVPKDNEPVVPSLVAGWLWGLLMFWEGGLPLLVWSSAVVTPGMSQHAMRALNAGLPLADAECQARHSPVFQQEPFKLFVNMQTHHLDLILPVLSSVSSSSFD